MPVLLVVGELDKKFSAIADDMAAAIGELATIGTIRGVGHAAPWEHPDWFAALLRSWFEDNPMRL